DDLERGLLLLGVFPHRDATTVVDHPNPAVGEQRDLDLGGVAGHGLVDGVVHHFPDKMVKTTLTRGADVHTRAQSHCFQPPEHGDGAGAVSLLFVSHGCGYSSSRRGLDGPVADPLYILLVETARTALRTPLDCSQTRWCEVRRGATAGRLSRRLRL